MPCVILFHTVYLCRVWYCFILYTCVVCGIVSYCIPVSCAVLFHTVYLCRVWYCCTLYTCVVCGIAAHCIPVSCVVLLHTVYLCRVWYCFILYTCVVCGIAAGTAVHYVLPMDRTRGSVLINPSGLDAKVFGAPRHVEGNKFSDRVSYLVNE